VRFGWCSASCCSIFPSVAGFRGFPSGRAPTPQPTESGGRGLPRELKTRVADSNLSVCQSFIPSYVTSHPTRPPNAAKSLVTPWFQDGSASLIVGATCLVGQTPAKCLAAKLG
jgi:hypothetical protein